MAPWRSHQPQGIAAKATDFFNHTAKPVLLKALEQSKQWAKANKPHAIAGALTAALLLLNLKSLPLVWHVRVFYNSLFTRRRYFESRPGSVFRPVVTSSRVSWLETDYSLSKSNSTFFSDLDVARADLLATLRAQALRGGLRDEFPDRVRTVLSGTSCNFKKEMRAGFPYDMHSRVLTWDRKYIYVLTHFVERCKGSDGFPTYNPFRKTPRKSSSSQVVYATALSKCVVKSGTTTVPPEKFFRAAGLVRPDTSDMESMICDSAPSFISTSSSASKMGKQDKEKKSKEKKDKKDKKDKKEKKSKRPSEEGPALTGRAGEAMMQWMSGIDGWTWDRVEEERVRGLRIAEGFGKVLDAAHDEFHHGL